jgi:hypothetical protein
MSVWLEKPPRILNVEPKISGLIPTVKKNFSKARYIFLNPNQTMLLQSALRIRRPESYFLNQSPIDSPTQRRTQTGPIPHPIEGSARNASSDRQLLIDFETKSRPDN